MDENLWMYVLGAAVVTPLVPALKRRLELSGEHTCCEHNNEEQCMPEKINT